MRALVQRVTRAAVDRRRERSPSIGPGLLVLLGVTHDDGPETADRLADKVRALRVFADAEGRMNEPLGDRAVLCISQFTLYGDARRGNRPSYVAAARPEHAEPLYERFCERARRRARRVRRAHGGRARQRRPGDHPARGDHVGPRAPMPPVERFICRFAAEPPQEDAPDGDWAATLQAEFLAACLRIDTEGEELGEAERAALVPRPHLGGPHLRAR